MLGWYDNADDSFTTWDASNLAVGEQSFVPLPGDPDPTRGWWTTIATDRTDHTSRLLIIPAADPASGPVATVALPQRVPLGLHGSWQPTGEWRPPRRPDPDRSNRSPTLDRISDCTELAGSPAA